MYNKIFSVQFFAVLIRVESQKISSVKDVEIIPKRDLLWCRICDLSPEKFSKQKFLPSLIFKLKRFLLKILALQTISLLYLLVVICSLDAKKDFLHDLHSLKFYYIERTSIYYIPSPGPSQIFRLL